MSSTETPRMIDDHDAARQLCCLELAISTTESSLHVADREGFVRRLAADGNPDTVAMVLEGFTLLAAALMSAYADTTGLDRGSFRRSLLEAYRLERDLAMG